MEVVLKITCLTLLVFGYAQSAVLPVEKCTLIDKACMLSAAQKMAPIFVGGMPDNGVEVLDPMVMPDVKFDLSGLQFGLTEGTLKGMKKAVIKDFDWNTKKKVFSIEFNSDLYIKGHYTAAGRVLILPITGDGQMKLKMKNLRVKIFIHYDTVKKGDVEHIKPTKYNFEFEIIDGATFGLTNLFNGNKELSDAMLIFLNENWKQISIEFGHPMVDTAAKVLYNNIAAFLDKQPIGEIANL